MWVYKRKKTCTTKIPILTPQSLLNKNISAIFLDTSISENAGDLKGRGCILTLQ